MENNYTQNGKFCVDDFWNVSLTWYSAVPDFTQCFQHTIFILFPCATFCIIGIINIICNSKRSVGVGFSRTILYIVKIVICILLISISMLELAFFSNRAAITDDIVDIRVYSCLSKIFSYIIIILALKQNKRLRVRSCALLSIFWLIFSICCIILYRSASIRVFNKTHVLTFIECDILYMVQLPLVLCQLLFSLLNDPASNVKRSFDDAPFFSFITFFWFNRYIYKGAKKLLNVQEFQPLSIKLHATYVYRKFLAVWTKTLSNIAIREGLEKKSTKSALHFYYLLTKPIWPYFTLGCILHPLYVLFVFVPPLLLDKILAFMSEDDFIWKGYFYCGVLFLSEVTGQIIDSMTLFFTGLYGCQIRSILVSAIYRKALKLSTPARQKYTCGEMMNLMSVDVDNVYVLATLSNDLLGLSLKFVLTVIMLWRYLGPSCLAGGFIIILMMLLGGFFAAKTEAIQTKQMEAKDSRLKHMTEILNGIKVLKLYAWEIPFMESIGKIRKEEVGLIRKLQLYYAGSVFIWVSGPIFVGIASFGTYSLVNSGYILNASIIFVSINLLSILQNTVVEIPGLIAKIAQVGIASFGTYSLVNSGYVLNASIIFVSINLLSILQNTVVEIPGLIAKIAQTKVSLIRLMEFLLAVEHKQDAVGECCVSGEAVSIRNGVFSWSCDEESTLTDINFDVPCGSLVAITGSVGSGKSSLLSAILGEIDKKFGFVDVKGSISYVPQQAWILNRTLRDNILFVSPMDRPRYNDIIDACCLRPDLKLLSGGDKTEIGEKGINLSGGQKQRVSLARSIYHDTDIYLLDDPLSAVDSHVGKHIFEHVVSKTGLLRNKTRILVTHNLNVLPETDFIVTMKDGRIQETGTYVELTEKGGVFADFIAEHANIASRDVIKFEGGRDGSKLETEPSMNTSEHLQRNISYESTNSDLSAKLMDEENMEIGQVKIGVYFHYIKHIGLYLIIGILLGFLSTTGFELGLRVWLSEWSGDALIEDEAVYTAMLRFRIAMYAVLGLWESAGNILGTVCLAYGSARAAKLYHKEMLFSIMRAPMSFFDTTPLGRIVNRFGRDINEIDINISMHVESSLTAVFRILGTIAIITINTPYVLFFLVIAGIAFYVIQKYYLITSRHLIRLSSTSTSPIYNHFIETINGTSSIRAYDVENAFVRTADEKLNTNTLCQLYSFISGRWLEFNVGLIGNFLVLVVAVLLVQSRNILEPGVVGLSLTSVLSVKGTLTWLIFSSTRLENKFVSVERIEEYSKIPPEAPWIVPETDPPPIWPSKGKLQFRNFSTTYRTGLDLVLKNINLDVYENEKVGIVGRTGAGKSSFALALFRIIESVSGKILIDDVDVSKIGLHQLRSKLTIIPQDPVLFTGSLRMNLDPDGTHSDNELWSSLENANLKDFVSSLSEGLDHEIAEGGDNLSVGQRQLVCLARALLKQAKILILDEATAAVDMETDRMIQNTVRTEFKEYTVITIAHRLNTIMDYDKVVVMDSGEIVEVGRPTDLLQRPNSRFYNMTKDAGLL